MTTVENPTGTTVETRLRAAVEDLTAKTEMTAAARELRDQLIVEAHDEAGWSEAACARAANLSRARVSEILAAN